MRAYRVPAERAKMDPEDHDVLMDAEREGNARAPTGRAVALRTDRTRRTRFG